MWPSAKEPLRTVTRPGSGGTAPRPRPASAEPRATAAFGAHPAPQPDSVTPSADGPGRPPRPSTAEAPPADRTYDGSRLRARSRQSVTEPRPDTSDLSYLADRSAAAAMGVGRPRPVRVGRKGHAVQFVSVDAKDRSLPRPQTPLDQRPTEAGTPLGGVHSILRGQHGATSRDLHLELQEHLRRLPSDDRIGRVLAHRQAFTAYIDGLPERDAGGRELLGSVLGAYDELQFLRFDHEAGEMMARIRAAEARVREAEEALRRQNATTQRALLEADTLRRQLSTRNEVLWQIAVTYRINVSSLNWITGAADAEPGEPGTLTMAEIRQAQKKMVARYGAPAFIEDTTRPAPSDSDAESGDEDHDAPLDEESLLPRFTPSRSRLSAEPGDVMPRELELLQECRDDADGVDLSLPVPDAADSD